MSYVALPTDQPTNQPTNQPIDQPKDQPTKYPYDRWSLIREIFTQKNHTFFLE